MALMAISAVFAIESSTAELKVMKKFQDYIVENGKVYQTQEEFLHRFENFKSALERVEKKNIAANGKTTYALNKFSDLSTEEFRKYYLLPNPIPGDHKVAGIEVLKPTVTAVPASLDWRVKGAVTAIKNQEQCGSCWAFSATEAIESAWILAGKSNNATLNLAPQQIVDCDNYDGGCNGGETGTAYDYVISAGGLEGEASYPYQGQDGTCEFSASEVVAKIGSWNYATEWYSETTLQQNLVSWGPLSICVDASNWQDYASGVMTWEQCAYVNLLDHCVQLVGYATDPSDGPYWIVRNSWGTSWGVDGFIYLEMWADTCGIAHQATWPKL